MIKSVSSKIYNRFWGKFLPRFSHEDLSKFYTKSWIEFDNNIENIIIDRILDRFEVRVANRL